MGTHLENLKVVPGTRPDLAAIDPAGTPDAPGDKKVTREALADLRRDLDRLQHRLHAEGDRSLLLVLQGMDASGKDGVVRNVLRAMDPQAARVVGFGKPNGDERRHDFLWRFHAAVPAAGEVVTFDRSYYEGVLAERVHEGVSERTWRKRYDHVNAFEDHLVDEGTTILKVLLHVSAGEQRNRLQERIDDPDQRWLFDPADLEARARWDDHQAAFVDALAATSTEVAPWYVVPSDRAWYRDWAVADLLVDTLERMDPQFPRAPEDVAYLEVE